MGILYFFIAIAATTVGAVTGMGGGVFMKPILDMLGHYDVATINLLSAVTVFAMAVVSTFRQRKSPDRPDMKVAVSLAAGAVAGGNLGGMLLKRLIAGQPGNMVTAVQNIALGVLIVFVIVYMANKAKIKPLGLDGIIPSVLTGLFLGFCSSFMGIGGGPINVAIIILFFGYSTKKAALCSLITILFSQATKVAQTAFGGGFGGYDLSVLPFMVVGAILGGLIGAQISKKIDEKRTDGIFQIAQVVILLICAVNIFRNI